MKRLNRIYLIGASGHAKVVADIVSQQKRFLVGVFDQNPDIERLLHLEVKPQPEKDWPDDGVYLIAIGSNKTRKLLAERYDNELVFTKAIHPKAIISPYAEINEGTVVMAGATLNPDAQVGKQVVLNTNCSVDHDCIIGDYVHISPNAALAGNVQVGEGTHIGIGACVIQGIRIGKWCTIGAGAVVIRDVPDGATVVGNPAKLISRINNEEAI